MVIKEHDLIIKYSEIEIQNRIKELAEQIQTNYKLKYKDSIIPHLVCICILKGGIRFFNDLIKHFDIPICMDFIELSSYKGNVFSTRDIQLIKDLSLYDVLINQHDILIIEDIVDTGYTMDWLINHINKKYSPNNIKIASLIDKSYRREKEIKVDYIGFEDNSEDFLIGYGLDYGEFYRNLNNICIVKGQVKWFL